MLTDSRGQPLVAACEVVVLASHISVLGSTTVTQIVCKHGDAIVVHNTVLGAFILSVCEGRFVCERGITHYIYRLYEGAQSCEP